MSALSDAILELRVCALSRIGHLKAFGADEETVRSLAVAMTDMGVIQELRRRRNPMRRFLSWFDRRPSS